MPISTIRPLIRSFQSKGKRVFRDDTQKQTYDSQTKQLRDWISPVDRFSEKGGVSTMWLCRLWRYSIQLLKQTLESYIENIMIKIGRNIYVMIYWDRLFWLSIIDPSNDTFGKVLFSKMSLLERIENVAYSNIWRFVPTLKNKRKPYRIILRLFLKLMIVKLVCSPFI